MPVPTPHSDVGGGYRRDGLSDGALRFMLDEIQRRKLGLETLVPSQVRYTDILASDRDDGLDFDDVVIEPSPLGKNH